MQGHINFLAYSNWFDRARTKIYREFSPELDFSEYGVAVLHTDVDFLHETYASHDVEIRTWVNLIGEDSFEVTQELYQQGKRCAHSKTVLSIFDFTRRERTPIPPSFRKALKRYKYDPSA